MKNETDIETLFKENYRPMLSLAVMYLKDRDIASDIVHDLFAELAENMPSPPPGRAYLLQSVRNRCLNHIRNLTNRQRIMQRIKIESDADAEGNAESDMRRMERVLDAIDSSLPPKCALVMKLRYGSGLSYKKMAERLGISEVAVYKHLTAGIAKLRTLLIKGNNG